MRLEWVPLLQIQRDLYRMPRTMERFSAYLRTMIDESGEDLRLPPLVAMNPMAKEHVPALLDAYLALDAESIAAAATAVAVPAVADLEYHFKIGLVIADDAQGGWTNRYATEFTLFGHSGTYRSSWLSAVLWSSDPASVRLVRETVSTLIYRSAHLLRHGRPRTRRDVMAQEGWAMARAGCHEPSLDPDDLEYTRDVLAPFLDADDMRTMMEFLFGDAAGRTLGFTPRGLSHRAGLALALADARRTPVLLGELTGEISR